MSRFVIPQNAGLAGGPTADDFPTRLAKYIPGEILSIFTAAIGALAAAMHGGEPKARWIAIGLMLLCAAATAAYFGKAAPAGNVTRAHVIASPIAFLALAYPISSPLLGDWFIGYIAILAQAVAALFAFFLVPTVGAAAPPAPAPGGGAAHPAAGPAPGGEGGNVAVPVAPAVPVPGTPPVAGTPAPPDHPGGLDTDP